MQVTRSFLCGLGIICAFLQLVDSVSAAQPTPDRNDVLHYLLTFYCDTFFVGMHRAKSDLEKQAYARDYYKVLFVIWYGTVNPHPRPILNYDMTAAAQNFAIESKRFNLPKYVDLNDPLGEGRISDADFKAEMQILIMPTYYQWVLLRTRDNKEYKQSVANFRIYLDKAREQAMPGQ